MARLIITNFWLVMVLVFLLAVSGAAGEPEAELPHVQLFNEPLFLTAFTGWQALKITAFNAVSCTNRTDYPIWYGLFEKR
jgi:hypothetical protein